MACLPARMACLPQDGLAATGLFGQAKQNLATCQRALHLTASILKWRIIASNVKSLLHFW
jgi:hypothetical protein